MASPAVIQRVAEVAGGFKDAAPGHRFNLYFPIWKSDWSVDNTGKKDAIQKCTSIPPEVGSVLDALRARQSVLFVQHLEGVRIEATSTAPFATGLGNEHPVENGFAFLTPYGLPYLAGSGVKGVLRRAAEELALFPEEYEIGTGGAPTMLDVWWLFGFEGAAGAVWSPTQKEAAGVSDERKRRRVVWQDRFHAHLRTLLNRSDLPAFISRAVLEGEERDLCLKNPMLFLERLDSYRYKIHTRGALTFWDVLPKPPKNALSVEIMTPHYSDYYQAKISAAYPNGTTPHDAGQPNPIPFLAVPPGSSFHFHVVCEPCYLPDTLRSKWKTLVEQIFVHALEWLGFGAKTAVGYGAMELDMEATNERRARERQLEQTKAREHELQTATAGLPEDAAWVVRMRMSNTWPDNGAFLADVEVYLAGRETLSPEGYTKFTEEMERRWLGIMANPEAVEGKKQKPKFKDRPKKLAKLLLELKPAKT